MVAKHCFLLLEAGSLLCHFFFFSFCREAFKFHVVPFIVILRIKNGASGYFLKCLAAIFLVLSEVKHLIV